jgi:hypothetical protein
MFHTLLLLLLAQKLNAPNTRWILLAVHTKIDTPILILVLSTIAHIQ